MSELAPAGRRALYQRRPLRRARLDTSVLTTDIIAATRRPTSSSFVAGARAGTVRCLIPVHVWEEVPRVLADRHHEGGRSTWRGHWSCGSPGTRPSCTSWTPPAFR